MSGNNSGYKRINSEILKWLSRMDEGKIAKPEHDELYECIDCGKEKEYLHFSTEVKDRTPRNAVTGAYLFICNECRELEGE